MTARRRPGTGLPRPLHFVTAGAVVAVYGLWTNGLDLEVLRIDPRGGVDIARAIAVFASVLLALAAIVLRRFMLRDAPYDAWLASAIFAAILPTAVIAVRRDGEPYDWIVRSVFWFGAFAIYFFLTHQRDPSLLTQPLTWSFTGLAVVLAFVSLLVEMGAIDSPYAAATLLRRDGIDRYPPTASTVTLWVGPFLFAGALLWRGLGRCMAALSALGVLLYHAAFLCATRQHTIVLLASLVMVYFVVRQKRLAVAAWVIMGAVSVTVYLAALNPASAGVAPESQSLMASPFAEAANRTGTVGVRLDGIAYYWPHFAATYGLGYGLHSYSDGPLSPVKLGQLLGFNHADYGLIASLFQFGVLGAVLVMALEIVLLRQLKRLAIHPQTRHRALSAGLFGCFAGLLLLPTYNTFLLKPSQAFEWSITLFLCWAVSLQANPVTPPASRSISHRYTECAFSGSNTTCTALPTVVQTLTTARS